MSFESSSIHTMALDVTNDDMVESVITEIHKQTGRIDIVVRAIRELFRGFPT